MLYECLLRACFAFWTIQGKKFAYKAKEINWQHFSNLTASLTIVSNWSDVSFPRGYRGSQHFPVIHTEHFFHCRSLPSREAHRWLIGWLWNAYQACCFHRRYRTLTNEGRCHIDCPNKNNITLSQACQVMGSFPLFLWSLPVYLSWTGKAPAARDMMQTRRVSSRVSRLGLPWFASPAFRVSLCLV